MTDPKPDDFDRGNPLAAEMDDGEDIRNELREQAIKIMDSFSMKALRLVAMYDGNRILALDALVLAFGKGGKWIGEQSAVEVARKHFVTKAAVTDLVKTYQDVLGIGPMPGQRGEKARLAFHHARNDQLKTT